MATPPYLHPAPSVLQQQVIETRRQLVVGDTLTEAAVIVLLQPSVQHHLQLTCPGDKKLCLSFDSTVSASSHATDSGARNQERTADDKRSPGLSDATAWL